MKAQKDAKTGKWLIQFRYTNWQGERKKTTKRGFNTKRDAEEWVRNFLMSQQADFNMNFEEFVKIYRNDINNRNRSSTTETKDNIIDTKILPYFAKKSMNSITAADIRSWQNEVIALRKKDGTPYAETYLHTINNQLKAIFNYAVTYYDLQNNPCKKVSSMGKKQASEMRFLTVDEFSKFLDGIMDKQKSYVTFMTLFWTGMRLGEMLALTPADIDFKNKKLHITKSYQYINGEDIITDPKTEKSRRDVVIPDFLVEELRQFIGMLYGYGRDDRIFQITKSYLHHEMSRGAKAAGVKRIRIHDLRHSHISLLIRLGFSAVAIGNRVGHESQTITFHYAHMFPTEQIEMADKLNEEFVPGTGNGGDVQ